MPRSNKVQLRCLVCQVDKRIALPAASNPWDVMGVHHHCKFQDASMCVDPAIQLQIWLTQQRMTGQQLAIRCEAQLVARPKTGLTMSSICVGCHWCNAASGPQPSSAVISRAKTQPHFAQLMPWNCNQHIHQL